jgi:hypothetical protein
MKKYMALGAKFAILGLASAFEMFESYSFFTFIMPPEKYFMAFLGFGLTTPAMFGYMLLFKFEADTKLKKTISLAMMLVCVIGGVITAGFGMMVEGMARTGYAFAQSDIDFMAFAIGILIAVHCIAMILYFVGDEIAEAWKDEDGNGVPDIFEGKKARPVMASEVSRPTSRPEAGQK